MATAEIVPVSSSKQYFAVTALSCSGMKDLAVSPLRYWYRHINPDRPARAETPQMRFGTALHCLVLEPSEFQARYARATCPEDHPGCLSTIEEIRGWIRDKGFTPKGTRKAELITLAQSIDGAVLIWDVIQAEAESVNAGKATLGAEEFDLVLNAANSLLAEPKIQKILRDGEPEVALFGEDPATGIPLKARLDWLVSDCIADFKTFTCWRGKSIDESVADAIYYEGYYRQAYFYSLLHQRITKRAKPIKFVFAFVEAEPPHEVRIRELRPTNYEIAALNVYWQRAEIEVRHFCNIWHGFMDRFGEKPWRQEQEIEVLLDEELKGMAFA